MSCQQKAAIYAALFSFLREGDFFGHDYGTEAGQVEVAGFVENFVRVLAVAIQGEQVDVAVEIGTILLAEKLAIEYKGAYLTVLWALVYTLGYRPVLQVWLHRVAGYADGKLGPAVGRHFIV